MSFFKTFFGVEDKVKIENYDDFWAWFTENEKKFYEVVRKGKNVEKDFFNVLSPQIAKVREGFYFIAETKDDGTAELTVTANGDAENMAFVEQFVKAAPAIQNWKFIALKQEENDDYEVVSDGKKFNKDNIFFYANDNPDFPEEVDLSFVYSDASGKNPDIVGEGVEMFVDDYLGELRFATQIDSYSVIPNNKTEKELIPITELKAYLDKREADFNEKFSGSYTEIGGENCRAFEVFAQDGFPVRILLNLSVINWKKKNAYPWISTLKIQFSGLASGLPDEVDYETLNAIDDEMKQSLKAENGHLYIGRETYNNTREVYFASKDFRQTATVFDEIIKKYQDEFNFETLIVKDKHWKTFAKYNID